MTLADLGPRGELTVRHVPIAPRRDLARLAGSLDELLTRDDYEALRGCFVSVELTDHPPPLQAMERLRMAGARDEVVGRPQAWHQPQQHRSPARRLHVRVAIT